MDKAFKEAFNKILPETEQLLKDFLDAGCAMNDSLGVKHLQGKWIAKLNRDESWVVMSGNIVIATLHRKDWPEWNEANARLIAASPIMLETLKDIRNHEEARRVIVGDTTVPKSHICKRAEAAIEKATA